MSLLKKIPELEKETEMFISQNVIRNLTDNEFIELWNMPKIVIHCTNATKKYVEQRRRKLELIKTVPDSSI
jgi:hypothetical protein